MQVSEQVQQHSHVANENMIDLRSDTFTVANDAMREHMRQCDVGDEAYREDPSVRRLEERCATMFGTEDAVFIPTGTMSNQIAINLACTPGDEVLTDFSYHLFFYESAQAAALNSVVFNVSQSSDGILTADLLRALLDRRPRGANYAVPKLVTLENTINFFGGRVFPLDEIKKTVEVCREHNLAVHMDGARLFNACVAAGTDPSEYGSLVDSVSVCFSKGLTAPAGSILATSGAAGVRARKRHKWLGGTMHQMGFLAAASEYALDNHLLRLADDHANAALLAGLLERSPWLRVMHKPVQTNIVVVDVSRVCKNSATFVAAAARHGVRATVWLRDCVRLVTSIHVNAAQVRSAADAITHVAETLSTQP